MVKKFVLQWHIGDACNLRCRHCYQECKRPVSLTYPKLKSIYNQYKELLNSLGVKGHINITGGEPLCNPHLFKLLSLIKQDEELITFSILTNGTLVTDEVAKKIKEYNPMYVQVSLEGSKKTNDYIRGKGTYKSIAEGIKNLRNNDIFTSISFTASKMNYREFPSVVKYARKYHVNNVWSDRYIPLGDNADKENALNQEETQEYLDIMLKERQKLRYKKNNITTISMNRALQFTRTNDFAYSCTAGISLLTVMENGDLVPCRRMPIVVGNLVKDNMLNLYKNNKVLKQLRGEGVPESCKNCEHSHTCRGGLKCLSYALSKDFTIKDVGCNIDC